MITNSRYVFPSPVQGGRIRPEACARPSLRSFTVAVAVAPGSARAPTRSAPARGRALDKSARPRVRWKRGLAVAGSVSRVLFRAGSPRRAAAIIPLGRALPRRLQQPTRRLGRAALHGDALAARRTPAYVALLPMGFAVPPALPRARWALTPPFHPYRRARRADGGGLFSVALSSAFPPPGVTRHRALWSSDFPPAGDGPRRRSPAPLRRAHPTQPRAPRRAPRAPSRPR